MAEAAAAGKSGKVVIRSFRLVFDRPTARVYALVPDKAAP